MVAAALLLAFPVRIQSTTARLSDSKTAADAYEACGRKQLSKRRGAVCRDYRACNQRGNAPTDYPRDVVAEANRGVSVTCVEEFGQERCHRAGYEANEKHGHENGDGVA